MSTCGFCSSFVAILFELSSLTKTINKEKPKKKTIIKDDPEKLSRTLFVGNVALNVSRKVHILDYLFIYHNLKRFVRYQSEVCGFTLSEN